jgi:anti-anti-sigma factor
MGSFRSIPPDPSPPPRAEGTAHPDYFGVELQAGLHRCLLVLRGELDAWSSEPLAAALADPALTGAADVEIDCAELTFVDSSGVVALLEARRSVEAAGARCSLVRPHPRVREVFDLCGLGGILPPADQDC